MMYIYLTKISNPLHTSLQYMYACVCVFKINGWNVLSLIGDLNITLSKKARFNSALPIRTFDPCESSVTTPSHTPNLHQP